MSQNNYEITFKDGAVVRMYSGSMQIAAQRVHLEYGHKGDPVSIISI